MLPLVLTIECDDAQALDVMAVPEAFSVRLRRAVSYAHRPGGSVFYDKKDFVNNILALNSVYAISEIVEHVADAIWWQPPSDRERPGGRTGTRTLQGEMPLPSNLAAGARLVRYKLEVKTCTCPHTSAISHV